MSITLETNARGLFRINGGHWLAPENATARLSNGAYPVATPTGTRTLLRFTLGWSWADETPPAVRARLGV